MENEMIERVAKAIDPDCFHDELHAQLDLNLDRMRLRRAKARKAAMRAIEAMWEPSKEMIRAAMEELPAPIEIDEGDREAFAAMLRAVARAALTPAPHP